MLILVHIAFFLRMFFHFRKYMKTSNLLFNSNVAKVFEKNLHLRCLTSFQIRFCNATLILATFASLSANKN